jgi:hypothetical protein
MVGAAQSTNYQNSIFASIRLQNASKKITPIIKNATHFADTLPLAPCDDAIKYERATVASINSGIYWDVTGNAGLSSANFIGTTDAQPFIIKTANVQALKITGDGKRSINAQNAVSTGLISTAFNQATASGDYSFATGYLSNASGIGAVALGSSTASNTYSTAFGNSNASGSMAASFNQGQAVGGLSLAAGQSRALGDYSTALGVSGTDAPYSLASGVGVKTKGFGGTVVGTYNDTSTFENLNFSTSNTAFAVGIGAANTTRANALTVKFNGKVGIGTTMPDATLHVAGSLKIADGTQANGKIFTSDANGIGSWKLYTIQTYKPGVETEIYAESPGNINSYGFTKKSNAVNSQWWDGVILTSLHDTAFMLGGWKTGPVVRDSIFYSTNNFTTVSFYGKIPFACHTFTFIKSPDGYYYILGGDAFSAGTDRTSVYRSSNLRNWELRTANYGGGVRILSGGFADEYGNLYWGGGQASQNSQGLNDIWKSTDGGLNWTQVATNINIGGDTIIGKNITNQMKYFNGRVYVVGGGIYDNNTPAKFTYTKKVYSSAVDNLNLWKEE